MTIELGQITLLQSMVEHDILREGEMSSFMVRAGLLREILEIAAKAIEAQLAETAKTDSVEDESAVRDSEFAQGVSTNKLSMRRGGQ